MNAIVKLAPAVNCFISAHAMPAGGIGRFRYHTSAARATLYASCYAAMGYSLTGDLESMPLEKRAEWAAYLNGHQDGDGLYRDPVIFDQGWYQGDPLWCGRPHLTCHVVTALACLGAAAARPLAWLDRWRKPDSLVRWLEERDWGERIGWSGNEIMNIGTLLQYSREFHNDPQAGKAVEILLEWLSTHHINPATGVWGTLDLSDPLWRSHAVQAAYHWWPLFFYDGWPVPYPERAIDTLLATQNPSGGFGWGVHNPEAPFNSSACEDIDSIDPLCRLTQVTDYRRGDIQAALGRAANWVLSNQMADGGFVFTLGQPFEYGHQELSSPRDAGAMFPTWFRLLSLALIAKALPAHPIAEIPWQFTHCPGMQFWRAV